MKIQIEVNDIRLIAQLNDSETARRIAAALPLEGRANVWGDEIYFDIPEQITLAEDAVAEVEVGTLAFWPTGSAFCIFFGPTPVSTNEKPRAYSPVNVFGKVEVDASVLKQVRAGDLVKIREIPAK